MLYRGDGREGEKPFVFPLTSFRRESKVKIRNSELDGMFRRVEIGPKKDASYGFN